MDKQAQILATLRAARLAAATTQLVINRALAAKKV